MRVAFVLLTVTLEAANWPSFRGPGATGILDGQRVPVSWSKFKWKTPIPGLGHSSPVVWGEQVFVTTSISGDPKSLFKPGLYGAGEPVNDTTKHMWKLFCLDRKTGKILWEKTIHEAVPAVKRHPKASHASSTPAVDGKHILVFLHSEGLYCYAMDGTLLWKKDLGVLDAGAFDVPEFQWSNASSPLLHGNLAIVQCDVQKMESYIVAFDADSGNEVWRTARKTYPSWATPNVIETKAGAELVVNGTEDILGYEPATGKELWRIHGTSMISVPTPFLADGLIYAASGYSRFQQPIYAVKPGSRGDLTKTAAIVWTNQRAPYLTTPIVYRGYLHSIKTNCTMFVMDARTGKAAYQQRIGNGACTASPVAADGRVFIPTEDGEIYVIKAGPVYEVLGINKIGETLMATPALTDRIMIVRGEHHVFGIQ